MSEGPYPNISGRPERPMARVHLYLVHLQSLLDHDHTYLVARGMTLHPCILNTEFEHVSRQHQNKTITHLSHLLDITNRWFQSKHAETAQKRRTRCEIQRKLRQQWRDVQRITYLTAETQIPGPNP